MYVTNNRVAAAAQNLKKAEGPRKLYVGSLHYNINEIMLKAVFAPFGQVININIQRESNGTSKGYGFIEVSVVLDDQSVTEYYWSQYDRWLVHYWSGLINDQYIIWSKYVDQNMIID